MNNQNDYDDRLRSLLVKNLSQIRLLKKELRDFTINHNKKIDELELVRDCLYDKLGIK